MIDELLHKGFKRHKSGLTIRDKSNMDFLVSRPMGGMGDMIAILPAIEQLCNLNQFNITIAFPIRYHYLFNHLNVKLIDYADIENINEFIKDFGYHVDLGCPASDYEYQSNFHVGKSRVENFAESFRLPGIYSKAPKIEIDKKYGNELRNQFPSKKIIGLAIKSGHRSKDWPYFIELAKRLIELNYQVISFDEMEVIDLLGVYNIIRVEDSKIVSMLNGLDYLISMDSGLMWAALAQGIKTIALFGPTNGRMVLKNFDPELFRIVQNYKFDKCNMPCYYAASNNYYCQSDNVSLIGDCMKNISVDDVLNKLQSF